MGLIHLQTINRAVEVTWMAHTHHAVMMLLISQTSVGSMTIAWLPKELNHFWEGIYSISAEFVNTERHRKKTILMLLVFLCSDSI